jgi:SAM-dependent methyltransferase
MVATWPSIWAKRSLPAGGSLQAQLLAADGFDTAFGHVPEQSWEGYVARCADRLGTTVGSSIYEIGCGAGAFLYPLYKRGLTVGGLDSSRSLLAIARRVMPDGAFDEGDASKLPALPTVDFVLANSVFQYFPSEGYAHAVLERMAAKATVGVAILDVPDEAFREDDIAMRVRALEGPERYQSTYSGLEHRYYSRTWFSSTMLDLGLDGISISSQRLPGYRNAAFRFNAWGFKPGPSQTVMKEKHS